MTMTAEQPRQTDMAQRIEELGRIIMAYSEMTEKLQESHDQLQGTVAQLRDELSDKNRQLERRNRLAALGEMAAGMAHEIRNPLGAINLYASLLRQDLEGQSSAEQLIGKISSGVKRLEGLVSQVLAFTREITLSVESVDLVELTRHAIELAQPQLTKHDVACELHGPESLSLGADALLVGQAILNLLINSAEALGDCEQRRVDVTINPDCDAPYAARLTIHDSGPGIPQDVAERIFDPFFTTKATGTGLGPAIVHRIIEAHDGTIRVEQGEPGGAVFIIELRQSPT